MNFRFALVPAIALFLSATPTVQAQDLMEGDWVQITNPASSAYGVVGQVTDTHYHKWFTKKKTVNVAYVANNNVYRAGIDEFRVDKKKNEVARVDTPALFVTGETVQINSTHNRYGAQNVVGTVYEVRSGAVYVSYINNAGRYSILPFNVNELVSCPSCVLPTPPVTQTPVEPQPQQPTQQQAQQQPAPVPAPAPAPTTYDDDYYSTGSFEYYNRFQSNHWGRWERIEGRRVFVPYAYSGWAPYTNGYWYWTSYGWTWYSYDNWGYVTDYYGHWRHHNVWGWVWIEDDFVWHHCGVTFFYDSYGMGWAPYWHSYNYGWGYGAFDDGYWLGYQNGYRQGFRDGSGYYHAGVSYVSYNHFGRRGVSLGRDGYIQTGSTVIDHMSRANYSSAQYNPEETGRAVREQVQSHTGQQIQETPMTRVTRTTSDGRQVEVFHPATRETVPERYRTVPSTDQRQDQRTQPVPTETRPVETRPVETRPVETRPVETTPQRQQTRPTEQRPSEQTPAYSYPPREQQNNSRPSTPQTQPTEQRQQTRPAEQQRYNQPAPREQQRYNPPAQQPRRDQAPAQQRSAPSDSRPSGGGRPSGGRTR